MKRLVLSPSEANSLCRQRQVVFTVYVSAFFFSRIPLILYRFPGMLRTECGAAAAYALFILDFVGLCWVAQWAENEVRASACQPK